MAATEYDELCARIDRLHTGSDNNNDTEEPEWKRCILFKILSTTTFPIPILAKSLTQIWQTSEPFHIFQDVNNIYKVRFDSLLDLERVFNNTPWKIRKKNLLILERVLPDKPSTEYAFNKADFWIQFHGIPTNRLNIAYVSELASQVGDVHPIPENIVREWGTFARAKVAIDVNNQLKRSATGKLSHGKTYPVKLKVERLPSLSYFCGYLGHYVTKCHDLELVKKALDDPNLEESKKESLRTKSRFRFD